MKDVIWMAVTQDKYELPVAVADTATELGKLLGITANAIHSSLCHARRYGYKSRYVKVVIE